MTEERDPPASDPAMASARRKALTELPWFCEGCGHFIVTRTDSADIDEPPQHDCPVADRTVVFVAYQSSEQAAVINRRLAPQERTPLR